MINSQNVKGYKFWPKTTQLYFYNTDTMIWNTPAIPNYNILSNSFNVSTKFRLGTVLEEVWCPFSFLQELCRYDRNSTNMCCQGFHLNLEKGFWSLTFAKTSILTWEFQLNGHFYEHKVFLVKIGKMVSEARGTPHPTPP